MERKEIKNLNDFLNVGRSRFIYADYDNEVIDCCTLSEDIMQRLLNDSYLIRWYVQGDYYTLAVLDSEHSIICYITFFDDYVCLDLSFDILYYDRKTLKDIYSLFCYYYYYYEN